MPKFLACKVLSAEIKHVAPSISPEYFDPLCHALAGEKFPKYVGSLIGEHLALICGDCGGLSPLAERAGIGIPPFDDCIQMLTSGEARDPETLYLTDGWLRHFDRIFGLDRLPEKSKRSVLPTVFSSIHRIVYLYSEASREEEGSARDLAAMLRCRFESRMVSLNALTEFLQEYPD